MLQTMGGNPRNFNELDLYSLPSPCFVIDKKALRSNLEVLKKLKFENCWMIILYIYSDYKKKKMEEKIQIR